MIKPNLFLTASLCLLAGCGGGAANMAGAAPGNGITPVSPANASASSATPSAAGVRLELTAQGMDAIEPGERRSPLAFGQPARQAVSGLSALFGMPVEDATNSECGAGPTRIVRWSNGLRILAQDEAFQGWEIDQAGVKTRTGLEVGAARAMLEGQQARFEEGSLGSQFTIGSGEQTIGGLIENGAVKVMWAGLTCHMT